MLKQVEQRRSLLRLDPSWRIVLDRRTDGKEKVIDPAVAVSVPHSTHTAGAVHFTVTNRFTSAAASNLCVENIDQCDNGRRLETRRGQKTN